LSLFFFEKALVHSLKIKFMDFLYIVLGLVFLVLGGDWLLKSAVGMSLRLNISKIVIGMTVVSFATSAPELIVSIKAAISGYPDIALGNVVGSNIANIGLVLAIVMVISAMRVDETFFKTDWPAMVVSSLLLVFVLKYDAVIDLWDGMLFFLLLTIFVFYLIKTQKNNIDVSVLPDAVHMKIFKILSFLVLGGFALWGGSELLVLGAVNVAASFGVSDRVIAVTVVSVGTSIPELAASVFAALKKESSISIGNILGSNIFNILSVLGITAMIKPIAVSDPRLVSFDLWWMLAFAVILLPLVLIPKKGFLDRRAGLFLLAAYIVFVIMTFN
jgi:cation:H+ antiporter